MSRRLRDALLASGAFLALSACATDVDIGDDAAGRAQTALPPLPQTWQAVAAEAGPVENGWVHEFGDPRLVALVEEAQRRNTDLSLAAANILQARALARSARAALYPSLSAGAGITASRVELDLDGISGLGAAGEGAIPSEIISENVGSNASAQASWEIDLWGRIRGGYFAELENVAAAQADYRAAQLSVAAAVSQAYFATIEAAAQEELARDRVETAAALHDLVSLQAEVGEIAAAEVSLARAELAGARSALAQAERGRRQAIRALEMLLGRYPMAELANGASFPRVPTRPKTGVPSALLQRRPDLHAAERRVAAALYGEQAADRARLPSLSLTGMIQLFADSVSGIFDPVATLLTAGPTVGIPIFSGGELAAQEELADAQVRSAVAAYADVALQAFGEVENSLDRGQSLRMRQADLALRTSELARRHEVEQLRYRYGESSLLDVMQLRQQYLGARTELVAVERELRDQFVELSLALGGWWAESVAPIPEP